MLDHFPNRTSKIVLLALAASALAFAVISLASVATQVGNIAPGFIVWRNLVVPAVTSSSWTTPKISVPMRSVIVGVDGHPIKDADSLRDLIRSAPPGTFFRYRYHHDGEMGETEIATSRLRWADVLPFVVPYLLNGLILFGIALAVFYLRPELPAAHAFLALAFTFGGMLVLALDAFSSFWLQRLCFTLDSLVPGALLHFGLCFPEPRTSVKQRPQVKWLVYLPSIALAILQNWYLSSDPEQHLRINGWVYAADSAAALVVVASLAQTFLRSRSPIARQQVKAVVAGIALACLVPALSILATVIYGAEIPFNPLTIFLIVFPLSIGYAIVRHDLFEVDRFLRLVPAYGATTFLVFAIYAGLVVSGNYWLGRDHQIERRLAPFYLLLVVLIANPLRLRVQQVVDRLFYRQTYSYRATVEDISRVLASLLDTNQIAAAVLDAVVTVMSVEWSTLIVFSPANDNREFTRRADVAQLPTEHLPATLAHRLGQQTRLISRYELGPTHDQTGLSTAEVEVLERLDVILVVPLTFEHQPTGVLLLGHKRSGAFYSDEDVQLLQTLANQAALALKNAEAYEALRRAQQELIAAERLAAVGELAATVAHGIRNPLAGIRVAAQVAQDEPSDTQTVDESLTDIISEVDRLEQRVRAILDLARPLELNLQAHSPRKFLESFLADIRHRIPSGVALSVDAPDDLPMVRFDAPRVAEVMDALVNNACEAMDGKGSLILGAQCSNSSVALSVRDSGAGIDAARLARIFDLFYTTKATGTGVGLAMAKRLMERQGGAIKVASEVGRGTTFTLQFPANSPPL